MSDTKWVKKNAGEGNEVSFVKLPQVGEIEGKFINTVEKEGQYGPMVTHYFDTEAGKVGVNGFSVLNQEIADIEAGQLVRIEYAGKRKSKAGHFYSACDVFVAEEPKA